jgi:hypothetical protein
MTSLRYLAPGPLLVSERPWRLARGCHNPPVVRLPSHDSVVKRYGGDELRAGIGSATPRRANK